MKKSGIVLQIIIVIVIVYAYLKNDGLYVLTNIHNTELDWINKYAIYDVEFPKETIIEEFKIENDLGIPFISHSECIHATLLVPNESIEKIVPEFAREYDLDHSLDLSYGKTDEKIHYNVWMPRTVVKWLDKTQRSILYTVMQSSGEYTRVYLFIDKLGWNLWN